MNNASKGAPKSVGGTLADLLAARNLNQTEAATKLSLTRPYLNGIINGKYPLSMDLKMKLKSLLNVEPDFWAGVQTAHELWKGSPEGRRQLLEQGRYSRQFRDWYLLPMAAAIWSSPAAQILRFPAEALHIRVSHRVLRVGPDRGPFTRAGG